MAKLLESWEGLEGKVVMVTGASSGIGRAFCINLAKAGCKILAAARRVDRLESLCHELNQLSASASGLASASTRCPRAVAVELDITADGTTIEKSVQKAWDVFGHIHALINNAGFRGTVQSPLDLSEEEWNQAIRTNLTGTWLVSKYVGRHMRDAKQGGSVINISSITGLDRGHLPGGHAYASSKAGVNTLTKGMAVELGVFKIRVNSISPGLFKSEITESLMQKEWLHNVTMKSIPLRETGTADPALTSLIRYLIHDSSKYISGNMFIVDAGATLPAKATDKRQATEEQNDR